MSCSSQVCFTVQNTREGKRLDGVVRASLHKRVVLSVPRSADRLAPPPERLSLGPWGEMTRL